MLKVGIFIICFVSFFAAFLTVLFWALDNIFIAFFNQDMSPYTRLKAQMNIASRSITKFSRKTGGRR